MRYLIKEIQHDLTQSLGDSIFCLGLPCSWLLLTFGFRLVAFKCAILLECGFSFCYFYQSVSVLKSFSISRDCLMAEKQVTIPGIMHPWACGKHLLPRSLRSTYIQEHMNKFSSFQTEEGDNWGWASPEPWWIIMMLGHASICDPIKARCISVLCQCMFICGRERTRVPGSLGFQTSWRFL